MATNPPVKVSVYIPWRDETEEFVFNGDTGKLTITVEVPANREATITATFAECFWGDRDAKSLNPTDR